jgi:hypothetical protein
MFKRSRTPRSLWTGLLVLSACSAPAPVTAPFELDPNSPIANVPGFPITEFLTPRPSGGERSAQGAPTTPAPDWNVLFQTAGTDTAMGVAASCDDSAFIYTTGYTSRALNGVSIHSSSGPDLFVTRHTATGGPQWTRLLGSTNSDYGTAVALSCINQPAVYVAGYTYGGQSFALLTNNPGGTGDINAAANAGSGDAIIARYSADATGALQWIRLLGSPNLDRAWATATDASGNVYMVGDTADTMQYVPASEANPSPGYTDAFIAKYAPNGDRLWVHQLGTTQNEQARGVITDRNGNVYVSGFTTGALQPRSPATRTDADIFLAMYNSSGVRQWVIQFGSTADDYGYGIAATRQLNNGIDVYLVGYTSGSLLGTLNALNPTVDQSILCGATAGSANCGGGNDAFVLRFDTSTNPASPRPIWLRQFGTAGADQAVGVASDGGANVYVTGSTTRNLQTNAVFTYPPTPPTPIGELDAFTVKYSGSGQRLSVNQIDSVQHNRTDYGWSVAADTDNGVYTAGYTLGVFSTGSYTTINNATTSNLEGFLLKYADGCNINIADSRCNWGCGVGDVHYTTTDRRYYDNHARGEFLYADIAGDPTVVVQGRKTALNASVSVLAAIAARVGTDRVGVYRGQNPPLRINGQPITLAVNETVPLPGGGRVRRVASPYAIGRYTIYWTTGERLIVETYSAYQNVWLYVPRSRAGLIRGFFGNFNGVGSDDVALRDGTPVASFSAASFYRNPDSFTNSWRITQAESLFDYGPGESTDTFTDLNFPFTIRYTSNATPQQRQTATQICQNAGVTDPTFLEGCIYDLIYTEDPEFALGAVSGQTQMQTSPGGTPEVPIEPVTQGTYYGNFLDGTAGPEWSATTVTTAADGRRYLGPFSNRTVTFNLSQLAPHQQATLSFDLFIIGGWDGEGPLGPHFFNLFLDDNTQLINTTFANTFSSQSYPGPYPSFFPFQTGAIEIGTLGQPGGDAVYRLEYTFGHTASDLRVNFNGSNLPLDGSATWGVTNVDVQVK